MARTLDHVWYWTKKQMNKKKCKQLFSHVTRTDQAEYWIHVLRVYLLIWLAYKLQIAKRLPSSDLTEKWRNQTFRFTVNVLQVRKLWNAMMKEILPRICICCECVACRENQIQCRNTGRCIIPTLFCDGYDNCGDWSDEENCSEW